MADVYATLAKRSQDWVSLTELHRRLPGIPKSQIDAALKKMYLNKKINLTPNDDQGSLTQADRAAAMRFGESDMHMFSMRATGRSK